MRRILIAMICLFAASAAAGAQSVFDTAPGLYGDPSDPAASCAVNPHKLEFLANPAHALLTWTKPVPDETGRVRSQERYDILGSSDGSLTLRLERDVRRTDDGSYPIWIMRMTENGYCWGREDWTLIRCERPQVRCVTPIS
jgi:hypothetical protein